MANLFGDLNLVLETINDVLAAGVAIIAFSLFINSLTFKIRDSVTNSFTILLMAVVVIFGTDSFFSVVQSQEMLLLIVKIHWFGLSLLPTAYFLFSDGLLTLTGKPSRGRRRFAGYLFIAASIGFAFLLFTDLFVGRLVIDQPPAPFFQRTIFNDLFSVFFFSVMGLSWYNFIRTYKRTLTKFSRRRMLYLIISAIGPALGSFPYLLYGSTFASEWQIIFWSLAIIANSIVGLGLIGMTYAVSFFGFPWPDRVIKSRLFRWLMRGPVTASLTLGVTTIISRFARYYNVDASSIVVLAMVATIVVFEFLVTIFAPIWERIFFYGDGKQELQKIRALEDRLLTVNDVRQFLELILASICDRLQISGAFLLVNNFSGSNLDVKTGIAGRLKPDDRKQVLDFTLGKRGDLPNEFSNWTVLPIRSSDQDPDSEILGIVMLKEQLEDDLEPEKRHALKNLFNRAALALKDRKEQENLFTSLEMLTPQVSVIQDLLAKSRVEQGRILNGEGQIQPRMLEGWVKDALTQIWGGPKLLQNPIMRLNAIQSKINQENETPLNAVRELLREAADFLKPEGERQYTNEWVLFNLVDLKFFEGWKVRDIARKLALSEADLYRKQRIAINEISKRIIELEEKASR
ncbi:MAG: hypothetical protein FJZ98_03065 [Chloroflexi bacterium]|nr:hypothetical protein [Chloroflexota bacterium]